MAMRMLPRRWVPCLRAARWKLRNNR
ncbi:uncharacterized protein METZ01_LOCUS282388 [marine metagenome]|uniref:Uncharacterized protein n=1 Tax=marine metagenome TaxID=408172 RepID=A0A382KXN5_9ZZZZ